MSSESPNNSPLASPSSTDSRKPAPPPRRAFSAKLVPMKVTSTPTSSSNDDSGSPMNSPAPPAARPRLGSGAATNSPPASPSISPSPSANIIVPATTPEPTFTPPPATDSPGGSQPSSPASRRLQNRHSMMTLMKDVRKINTSPVPPPAHQRAAELKIPKPPPSNIPKSVTDDDAVDRIASLVISLRASDAEVEAARRIFAKLDINGDGLISLNDFLRFRFDPVNRALHERVASFFAAPPQTSITQARSTPAVPSAPQSRQTIDEIPIHRPKSKPYDATIVAPIPIQAVADEPSGASLAVPSVSTSSNSSSASTPTVSPSTSNSSIDSAPPVVPAPAKAAAPLSPRSASLSSGSVSPRGYPKPPMSPRRTTLSADSTGHIPLPVLPPAQPQQEQKQQQAQENQDTETQSQSQSQPQPQPQAQAEAAVSSPPPVELTKKESFAVNGPPAPSHSMARIAHTLAGMDLPDTPRENEEPEPAPAPAADSVQKGLSFRDVDWEKVNAQADEDSGEENKLDDWDKPRDEAREDTARAASPSASSTSSHPPSPMESPSSSKSEKRKSAKALFSGARSKSSKMLSGLVNKLNGKPSKDSK